MPHTLLAYPSTRLGRLARVVSASACPSVAHACGVHVGPRQVVALLDQLNLMPVERKARVLTHQLASLTLLAYSKSLAEHKDAPMFGHTVRG